jgi:hypothetical protein
MRGGAGRRAAMRRGAQSRMLRAPHYTAVLCRHLGLDVLACHSICEQVRVHMGAVWGGLWGVCDKKPQVVAGGSSVNMHMGTDNAKPLYSFSRAKTPFIAIQTTLLTPPMPHQRGTAHKHIQPVGQQQRATGGSRGTGTPRGAVWKGFASGHRCPLGQKR